MLVGHGQVHDGQHHEYEGLQRDDQQMEDRPHQREHELHDQKEPAAGRLELNRALQRQDREQQEDHLAGEQIAVQAQRERDRAREKRHDLENQVGRDQQHLDDRVLRTEGLQSELGQEPAETLHLDAVVDDEKEDTQGERERHVEIGAGDHFQMPESHTVGDRRQQVHRQDVHGVEQEHPAEDGQCQRRQQLVGAMESVLDLVVDELDDQLHEVLKLRRHAGGGSTRREIERTAEHDREQN